MMLSTSHLRQIIWTETIPSVKALGDRKSLLNFGIQSEKQFVAKSKQGTWTHHAPLPAFPALGNHCEI